jgi:Flp pilus assembly protein TadG
LHPRRGRFRRVGSLARDRRGTGAIEFALAFPAFIFFVVGLIEFSRIFWTNSALQLTADQTSRYVMANPTASLTQIQEYAAGQLLNVDASTVAIGVNYDTTGGVNFVTVTASAPIASITRLVPVPSLTLTGRSRVPLTG